jgi:hypothetical protein
VKKIQTETDLRGKSRIRRNACTRSAFDDRRQPHGDFMAKGLSSPGPPKRAEARRGAGAMHHLLIGMVLIVLGIGLAVVLIHLTVTPQLTQ